MVIPMENFDFLQTFLDGQLAFRDEGLNAVDVALQSTKNRSS